MHLYIVILRIYLFPQYSNERYRKINGRSVRSTIRGFRYPNYPHPRLIRIRAALLHNKILELN